MLRGGGGICRRDFCGWDGGESLGFAWRGERTLEGKRQDFVVELSTKWSFMAFLMLSGNSERSFSLARGRMVSKIPARRAATIFAFEAADGGACREG